MTAPTVGRRALCAALVAVGALAVDATAQVPLTTKRIAQNLALPTWAGAPPGDSRLFVCEQNSGRIRIVKNGVIALFPFLDVGALANQGGERGLLGLAFHPDYASNGYFYIVYSDNAGDTVVVRYTRSANDPDRADPTSAFEIVKVPQPAAAHNGGGIQFGPDGMLWLAFGDGGATDTPCAGQSWSNLLGKIVRIDVDAGTPYAIPADNPWAAGGPYPPETWAVGLRNPWRWFVDVNGDLYIGDVGASLREELDYAAGGGPGRNYGWITMEGDLCVSGSPCLPSSVPPCNSPFYTAPVHVYDHTQGCTIIGGVVYRGCAIAGLDGTYFFGDYCSGRIHSLRMVGGQVTELTDRTAELAPGGLLGIGTITHFGLDGQGNVLIVDHSGGEVFRIEAATPGADCDADGALDSCEIAGDATLDLDGDAVLDRCEGLAADTGTASAATGGAQHLELVAGPAHANLLYIVLGSASGTAPPFPAGSVLLPLVVFDPWFQFTLANANGPLLPDSLGLLDAQGEASASVIVPPLDPSAVGVVLHHAALGIDVFGSGLATWVSHALPLEIVD